MQKSSFRDLVQRSCHETFFTDLVQRPGDESRGLARRPFLDGLDGDLPLRSFAEIVCGDLLKTPCTDSLHRKLLRLYSDLFKILAKRPLIEILYTDLARPPLVEILYRDIVYRSVAEILPRGLLH